MKKLLIGVLAAALIVSMSGVASAQGKSNPSSAAMERISKVLSRQVAHGQSCACSASGKRRYQDAPD